MAKPGTKQAGLTLIETLVALAIMGLVTGAILALVGQNTRFASSAENRAYAGILADNLMVEALAKQSPIEVGIQTGARELAGRDWEFEVEITETPLPGAILINVVVSPAGSEQVLARASSIRRGDE